jgi:hypothetical protein
MPTTDTDDLTVPGLGRGSRAKPGPCGHDGCEGNGTLAVFAAYPVAESVSDAPHPLLRRYPFAMYRSCAEHLGEWLLHEAEQPGSTRRYLVAPIEP